MAKKDFIAVAIRSTNGKSSWKIFTKPDKAKVFIQKNPEWGMKEYLPENSPGGWLGSPPQVSRATMNAVSSMVDGYFKGRLNLSSLKEGLKIVTAPSKKPADYIPTLPKLQQREKQPATLSY